MQSSALILRSSRPSVPFTSLQRGIAARRPLHLACSLPRRDSAHAGSADTSQQTAQPKGVPAALAALIPAASSVFGPSAAWAQTELPQATALYELADLDAKTAGAIARVVQPLLAVAQLLMIVRIVLSWYPQVNSKNLPWSVAVLPTEWVLGPTRRLIPPVGGVDIAPIVWFAFLSFTNEILVGPQGILNLLQRKL
jgi:YggT family protein